MEEHIGPLDMAAECAKIAALVTRRLPLTRIYREIHRVLMALMPAKNMFIARLEGEGLAFPYYIDERLPENELAIYPMTGLTAHLIRGKRLRWLSREPELFGETTPIGEYSADWLGVPLIDRTGAAIGALVVQTYEPGEHYSDQDAAFVQFVATQLALAFQLQQCDRERAVRRIAALVEDTTELDCLYPRIHEIAAELIPPAASSFIIARLDREAGLFRQVYCHDEREPESLLNWPIGVGLSSYLIAGEGHSFIFEDGVTQEPGGFHMAGAHPAFWLGAPIRAGSGTIIGVVMINSYNREEPITREDERSLLALCPHIAHAIAQTELLHRTMRN